MLFWVAPALHSGSSQACTILQADFLKLLYDKLTELHMKHADTRDEWKYPLPSFKANPCQAALYLLMSEAHKTVLSMSGAQPSSAASKQ